MHQNQDTHYLIKLVMNFSAIPLSQTCAFQIGLVTLKDLAFNVIRSKMNDENIVGEFFSKFSSE